MTSLPAPTAGETESIVRAGLLPSSTQGDDC